MTNQKPVINPNIHDRREIRFFFNQLIPPSEFDPQSNTPTYALYVTIIFDRGSLYTTPYYYIKHFEQYNYEITTIPPSHYDSISDPIFKQYITQRYLNRESFSNLRSPWTLEVHENYTSSPPSLSKSDSLYLLSYERYIISRTSYILLHLVTPYIPFLYTLSPEWSRYTRIYVPEAYLIIERYRKTNFFQCVVHIKKRSLE